MPHVLQGVGAAKLAWKKKNAVPQTSKETKAARPTGRGDGGGRGQSAPNRGGGRGRATPGECRTCRQQGLAYGGVACCSAGGGCGSAVPGEQSACWPHTCLLAHAPGVEGLPLVSAVHVSSGASMWQESMLWGVWQGHHVECVACQQWDQHIAAG